MDKNNVRIKTATYFENKQQWSGMEQIQNKQT